MKLAVILCLGATLLHSAYGDVDTVATGNDYYKGAVAPKATVDVSCLFTGLPAESNAVTFTWKVKDGAAITSGSGADDYKIDTPGATAERTSTLTIPKAKIDAETGKTMTYECTTGAEGADGAGTKTKDVVLTIYTYKGEVTPATRTVTKGKDITLTCTLGELKTGVANDATDYIQWQDSTGNEITDGNGYTVGDVPFATGTQGKTLKIEAPKTDEPGDIDVKCQIETSNYGKQSAIDVKVTVANTCAKPTTIDKAKYTPDTETVNVGDKYTVSCDTGHKLKDNALNTLTCADDAANKGKTKFTEDISKIECVAGAMGLAGATSTLMLLISYLLL